MKVWMCYSHLIDWLKKDDEPVWSVHKKKEDAVKAFEAGLDAFYERFGKLKPESYTFYHVDMEDGMVVLKTDEFWFALWYEEVPVF